MGTVENVEALRPAVAALAAVTADDPSQVDLLEEALALHAARFAAWLPSCAVEDGVVREALVPRSVARGARPRVG